MKIDFILQDEVGSEIEGSAEDEVFNDFKGDHPIVVDIYAKVETNKAENGLDNNIG